MGARRQQCSYHRAPQSAGATGYHHVTITKIHPTLLFPAPQSSGARHRLLLRPRQGPDNLLLLPAPTLKRSLRPSAASSSISAVTRMAWASSQSAGIDSALTGLPV